MLMKEHPKERRLLKKIKNGSPKNRTVEEYVDDYKIIEIEGEVKIHREGGRSHYKF